MFFFATLLLTFYKKIGNLGKNIFFIFNAVSLSHLTKRILKHEGSNACNIKYVRKISIRYIEIEEGQGEK